MSFVLTGILRKWVHSATTKFEAARQWNQQEAAHDVLSAIMVKYTPSNEGFLASAIDSVVFDVNPSFDSVKSMPDWGSIAFDIQTSIIEAIQQHGLKLTLKEC